MRTESSYRFERGGDVGICDWASQRAAQLILQTAGGQLDAGIVDAYPNPVAPKQITSAPDSDQKVSDLLGIVEFRPRRSKRTWAIWGCKKFRPARARSGADGLPIRHRHRP